MPRTTTTLPRTMDRVTRENGTLRRGGTRVGSGQVRLRGRFDPVSRAENVAACSSVAKAIRARLAAGRGAVVRAIWHVRPTFGIYDGLAAVFNAQSPAGALAGTAHVPVEP